jgi:6,7-dimethyl-8-ribityllumazine synthase
MQQIEGSNKAPGCRFALIVSRYHDFVTDRLLASALEALAAADVATTDVAVVKVPGAFEIPAAARRAAETRQFDAIICLGCLIQGGTPHFDYIASAVAHGITEAAGATGVPMAFGVLTTNTVEQALERAGARSQNKGWEAAAAAIEMATLMKRMGRSAAPGIPV